MLSHHASSWHWLCLCPPLLPPHVHGWHASGRSPVTELLSLLHQLGVLPLLPADPEHNTQEQGSIFCEKNKIKARKYFKHSAGWLQNIHPCREDDDQEEAASQPQPHEAEVGLKLALLHLFVINNIFQRTIHRIHINTQLCTFLSTLICLEISIFVLFSSNWLWQHFVQDQVNVVRARPADSRVVNTIYWCLLFSKSLLLTSHESLTLFETLN